MEIINWKKTSDFLSVLESIRGHEDDVVISVANRVNVGWYHIRLFLTLYPDRKIAFLTRDDRVRNLAKLSGCKVYTHPQELHNYLPSDFQIVQENLSGGEYMRFHVLKFFHKIFRYIRKKIFPQRMTALSARHTSWYVIVLGIILLLLLIIGLVSLTSPHASVIITPQTTIQNAVKNVVFVPEESISDPAQIPMRKDIFPIERTFTFHVNAYDPVSLARARGLVKIVNATPNKITLRAQTRVSYDSLVFRLERVTVIPAAENGALGEVTASVIADPVGSDGILMGKRGNIPKDTPMIFPGLSSEDHAGITLLSVSDFTGGDDVFKRVLSQEEHDRIEKTVREQIIEDARNYITNHYSPSAEFIPVPVPEALFNLDINIEFSEHVGTYVDNISVHARGNFLLYLYHVQTLKKILLETAYSHLLEGTESLLEVGDSPPDIIALLSSTKDPFTVKATAQLPVRVLYDFESEAGKKTLQNILSDLLEADVDRAEKTLLNHPYIKSVKVRLTPFWSNRLPSILDRIYVKVQNGDS